ncbi:MAG: hypothetical protein R6X02_11300 [Enhygromyxa sp.]
MLHRPVQKLAVLTALALLLPACKKKEEEAPAEEKKEEPKAPPVDTTPAEPQFDLSGPKPPETSTVVFAVDGALLPLACFDKDKGQLLPGKECGGLVAEGSEVYMESSFGNKALDKTGAGTKSSLCGDSGAIPTPQLEAAAAYDWAVWPKSLAPEYEQIHPDTWSDRGARLDEAEAKAVQDAIAKVRNVKGDFQPKQKATVDIDGDGKDELFVSAVLVNPSDPDTYLFSGLFMAPGGELGNLVLIDRSKKAADVIRLRGVVDLDGDGKRELWTGLTFDGGSGDRIVQIAGDPKPIGGWTCGAG